MSSTDQAADSHVTPRVTIVTALLLLVLWGASWSLSYVDLGHASFVVALAIAVAKAVLVALFFMELVTEKASFNLAIISGLAMIALLIVFVLFDQGTRATEPIVPPKATHPLTARSP